MHPAEHDHRPGRPPPGRLPGADRRRAAHPVRGAARPVHRRGRAGAAAGAAGRLPAAVVPGRRQAGGPARAVRPDGLPSTPPTQDLLRAAHRLPRAPGRARRRSTAGRCRTAADVLAPARRRVAILEDVNNHTNVGAIFRGAAALGHGRGAAVAVLRRPALPAQRAGEHGRGVRRAVRPAGAVAGRLGRTSGRPGFTVLALTPAPDAVPIQELDARRSASRPALLLGAEGAGLSAAALACRRRAGGDPDAPRRRLAQRRRRRRGRLLGADPRRLIPECVRWAFAQVSGTMAGAVDRCGGRSASR